MTFHGIEYRLVILVHESCEVPRIQRLRQETVLFRVRGQADAVDELVAHCEPRHVFRQLVHNIDGKVILEGPPEIPLLPVQTDIVPRHGTQQDEGPLEYQGEDDGIPPDRAGETTL